MLRAMARTNITTLVTTRAPIFPIAVSLGLIGNEGIICSQKRTPATKKLACISQMWMSLIVLGRVKGRRQMPGHHDDVEQHDREHTVRHETPERPQRPGPRAEENGSSDPAPYRDGERVDEREPWRSDHDENWSEEHDQDVLDHVDEKVVVGPVVDGRDDGQQEDSEAAIEVERTSAALGRPSGT